MAVDLMELARQQAEQGRNYNAAFEGAGQYGMPGTSGGEGGAGYTYDPNAALPTVGWSGPAAYGMHPAGTQFTPGTEAEMYAALQRARQFDPNATLVPQMGSTGEGGSIPQQQYVLNYDQSLVPQPQYPGAASVGNYGSNESVYNENLLRYDPNYGVMTDPRNLKGDQGIDWLGILGPAAVGGFAFGIPALAGAMSAGALGGAAGAGAGLSAADAAAMGSAESSLYGPTVAAAPEYALGSPMVAGSAESSLYGPEVLANPSQAVGDYPIGWGRNTLGQTYGRAAVAAGQQIGNRRFDPFAFVPAAASGVGAPWWAAPAVGAGKFAYDVNQQYSRQPQAQQQPQGYNPQNYGNMGSTPAKSANPDNQYAGTTYTGTSPYDYSRVGNL